MYKLGILQMLSMHQVVLFPKIMWIVYIITEQKCYSKALLEVEHIFIFISIRILHNCSSINEKIFF